MTSPKRLAAVGGGALPVYIEEIFQSWLYTGNGSTQTINNGIDLAGKGGLVWIKDRTQAFSHALQDTIRGGSNILFSNSDVGNQAYSTSITSFGTTGFTLGAENLTNLSGDNFASWTFRKQPKFFDVVTYTGTGANRTIAHNLGSVPACIMVKRTNTNGDWQVYHRSLANTEYLVLNTTAAKATGATRWNSTTPTSTVFSLGTDATVNASGGTYVAYIFAHDAGGFGLTGTDNVISCGSYTGNGSATGPVVDLGYEPQWVMVKQSSASGQWWNMIDVMRGFDVSNGAQTLGANASDAEYTNAGFGSGTPIMSPTATGFQVRSAQPATNASGATYIYIAIRRGPMKVPTSGTSVFAPTTTNQTGAPYVTTNFPVDLQLSASRSVGTGANTAAIDRLRAASSTATNIYRWLQTASTNAENTSTDVDSRSWDNTGFVMPIYYAGLSTIYWNFRRAPSFFDEVCYTGNNTAGRTVTHNLGVAPELIICKSRSVPDDWPVFAGPLGNPASVSTTLRLNTTAAVASSAFWNNTAPTASVFTLPVGGYGNNNTGENYVSYLFATCPGVSKVGSYTGTAATQTINCGFTGGARFVLIKRTNSALSWYVWDTARGMVSGTDPSLQVNSTSGEVSGNSVFTIATGFQIVASPAVDINAIGDTYIFLAIA